MSAEKSGEEENSLLQPETRYEEIDFKKENLNLLTCPECNHMLSGSEIDGDKLHAKCNNCNHEFRIAFDSSEHAMVPELLIPEGIEELKLRSELDLRLNWKQTTSKGGRWFIMLFAGLWNLILLPFVIGVILSAEWGILLFMSLHLLVGLGLLWHLSTIYMNRTSISVTRERIRITTIPLKHPVWRDKEIPTKDIEQLYVSRYIQSTNNGVPNYAFALYAILKSGEKKSLIRGMNQETQAYVEKAIEKYLGIKNSKVTGEAY